MSRILRLIMSTLAILAGLAGVGLALYVWRLPPFTSSVQWTDNAYVKGRVTTLAPQVSGYVTQIPVTDYQTVRKGDVLIKIDDRIYFQKVKQAEATLLYDQAQLDGLDRDKASYEAKLRAALAKVASAETALKNAQSDYDRGLNLARQNIVSKSDLETSSDKLEAARANLVSTKADADVAEQDLSLVSVTRKRYEATVDGAQAALELARIDFGNTVIRAPDNGRLGEVGARIGAYVTSGTQLVSLVPERIWVAANFKETQLAAMTIGMPVTFRADFLKGRVFTGRIESFSPATGNEFAVIKSDNATGNFTKVTQRLPVRIAIDPDQKGSGLLAPGMSLEVRVDTGAKP
jgi:multidrug resistance efflux pump